MPLDLSSQPSPVIMRLRVKSLMYVDDDETVYLLADYLDPHPPWISGTAIGLSTLMLEEVDRIGVATGDIVIVEEVQGGKGMMCVGIKIAQRGGETRLNAVQWPSVQARLPPLPRGPRPFSSEED